MCVIVNHMHIFLVESWFHVRSNLVLVLIILSGDCVVVVPNV